MTYAQPFHLKHPSDLQVQEARADLNAILRYDMTDQEITGHTLAYLRTQRKDMSNLMHKHLLAYALRNFGSR